MNYRNLFAKEYLAAEDLDGKDVVLTISRVVAYEEVHGSEGNRLLPVVYFAEMEARHAADASKPSKRLILNITNARTIARQHGRETDGWAGKQVTLYPVTEDAWGEQTDCIRIRGYVPVDRTGRRVRRAR